ncbi:MAG TPA: Lrp/AsnC family transcriptional regulator [Steroidobacteraceae bacterium]|jgi:Lrp/AsnC family transcriptional regulator, leucine-responsive regulatory protein|nr:Lrp/AsnC family transcriptional regulator [Steroidobacteraceae bacterium]
MRRNGKTNTGLDKLDVAILKALVENARVPVKTLAGRIGLSSPSTAERIRRLEEAGVIEGYSARLNPSALGLPVAVLMRIRPMPGELHRVAKLLAKKTSVVECDRVTGDDCFVAKAHVQTVEELERLIDDILPLATTNTAIIQSSPVKRRIPEIVVRPAPDRRAGP